MRLIATVAAAFWALVPAPSFADSMTLSGEGWRLSLSLPPGEGPFPAVVIMPGCSGNTPPAVAAGLRSHAARLVRGGIAAAVIDVLGGSNICADLSALVAEESAAARKVIAAARELAEDSRIEGSRIGFLGQSFGGSVALRLASRSGRGDRQDFAAIVAYYPWCNDGYGGAGRSDFDTPLLILAGGADQWTPVARCQVLAPAPGSSRPMIALYRDAYHSFDLPGLARQTVEGVGGSYVVAGDAAAAASSASRYVDFLGRYLRR